MHARGARRNLDRAKVGVGGNKPTAAAPAAPFARRPFGPTTPTALATLSTPAPAPAAATSSALSAAVRVRARVATVRTRRGVEFWRRLGGVRIEAMQHVALMAKEVDGVVRSASDDPDALWHFETFEK